MAVLGSGSAGNAAVVEAGGVRILLDAGFSCREMEARLTALGVDPGKLSALLLTHEHGDHARGAARFSARHGVPLLATPSTLRAAGLDSAGGGRMAVESGHSTGLGGWRIATCPVPHDAADPVAFRVETPEGSVGYALDLGHAPDRVLRLLEGCDAVVVESNHDAQMLEDGPYPRELKERLRGSHGHLSNEAAGKVVAAVVTRATRSVVLAHLSRTNNRTDLARAATLLALRGRVDQVAVTVAGQEPVGAWIEV